MHKAKKVVALRSRIARKLKIVSHRPIGVTLITKLPHSIRERIYVGMAREPAAQVVHLNEIGNLGVRKLGQPFVSNGITRMPDELVERLSPCEIGFLGCTVLDDVSCNVPTCPMPSNKRAR